jgi:NAD+ synthase (glutamine-hydrolysing)
VTLAESPRFPRGPQSAVADIGLDLMRQEQLRNGSLDDNRRHHNVQASDFRRVG